MKRNLIYILLILIPSVVLGNKNVIIDAKYIPIGIVSTDWNNQLGEDPNIRRLGTISESFNRDTIGKYVLDLLLQKDEKGLHMDRLYEQALQNTILEEEEIANLDISAEKEAILKKEVANQLLKSNYVVIVKHIFKKHLILNDDVVGMREFLEWTVYHVEIDDDIINQAFLNWETPTAYNQIKVPIKRIASHTCKPKNLRYDIYKRVPEFAIRGTLTNDQPIMTHFQKAQGVKKCDRVYIYEAYENRKGETSSKRVAVARVVDFSNSGTQLFPVSGGKISARNGQVAVIRDHNRSSLSIIGTASFGNDARFGGRLMYDNLLAMSKHGIAHYLLLDATLNSYGKKEPDEYWWQDRNIQDYSDDIISINPRLYNFSICVGYGIGFNFLHCLEVMPYASLGWGSVYLSPHSIREGVVYHWDASANAGEGHWISESWSNMYVNNFAGHIGGLLRINIYYPVQFLLGAEYNWQLFVGKEKPSIINCHNQNRLEIIAGLRISL